MKEIFITVLFIAVICSYSQTFTDIEAGLTGVGSGDSEWGDYDNDGDLDILLTGGAPVYGDISRIYRNDSGVFTDINAGLTGVSHGAAEWGDYDNDGDLDIILCGSGISKVYRNDTGVFTDIDTGLTGVYYSSVAWGDYDNDGDLDILLTGIVSGYGRISRIYRNDSGVFTDINAGLTGIDQGDVAWGDYDNDGDLDILISGIYQWYNIGQEFFVFVITTIYRNDGNEIFSGYNAGIFEVSQGSVEWGDYDNDGDLDIAISGGGTSKIYRNDSGVFTDINAGLTGISLGSIKWADFDNDGDLDASLTGYTGTEGVTKLYKNDSGNFTNIYAGLTSSVRGDVEWGDYDNDGDLDLLQTDIYDTESSIFISKIYRNNSVTRNTKPIPPNNVISELNGTEILLSWDKATDNETPQNGLSYNLYIGTENMSADIVNPMSDIGNGFRKIVESGNAQKNTSWSVKNLPDGTYYWSVQAIDHAFAGSAFSSESSFILDIGLPSTPVALDADVFIHSFNANWEISDDAIGYYIDVATDIDFNSYVVYVAKEPGFKITNLQSDTNYYFRVRSYNANGYSNYSNTIIAHTIVDLFTENEVTLTGVQKGSSAWGDYDNDGDLDVLMTGDTSTGYISKIFRNDSDVFIDVDAGLIGIYNSSVAWGDYDNDGDLDILLAGSSSAGYISKIYRNDSCVFIDINADLVGVSGKSAAWGDYDNDGDLDVFLSGYTGSGGITNIYRNDSGLFIDGDAGLIGIYNSSVAWGDYDNDGDLDILLSGFSSAYGKISKIYRNDSGVFTDINAGLTGVQVGSVAWGDYDNDGDLDILLCGNENLYYDEETGYFVYNNITRIYRNNNGIFTDLNADLQGVFNSSAAWGDYDNDGDLDVFLSGYTGSRGITKIYRNDSGLFIEADASLIGIYDSSVAWGDYDNDGDLDLLLSGISESGNISKIYRNNSEVKNIKPNPPINLSTDYTENGIVLSWDKATDAETPQDGLSYNIYIGSTSQTENIYSPMSDIFSGYRKIVSIGNANQNTSWTVKNLPTGEYYWSVQAIDHCFVGSEFAPEQYFTSIEDSSVPLTTQLYQNYPNPFNPETVIKYSLSNDAQVKLAVYNSNGQLVNELVNKKMTGGNHSVQFNGDDLNSGIYFYRLETGDKKLTRKMLLIK